MNKPRRILLRISFFLLNLGAAFLLVTFAADRYVSLREIPAGNSVIYCYVTGLIVAGIAYIITFLNIIIPDKREIQLSSV